MEKFPDDVIRAETAVNGDIEILTRDEFQETKKESYAGLFGNPKKTPVSIKKSMFTMFFGLCFVPPWDWDASSGHANFRTIVSL